MTFLGKWVIFWISKYNGKRKTKLVAANFCFIYLSFCDPVFNFMTSFVFG